jgi:hypothetical protein
LNIDDISLLTAEQVIKSLVNNRIAILCRQCQCQHEYTEETDSTVKLLDTGQRNTTIVQRERY